MCTESNQSVAIVSRVPNHLLLGPTVLILCRWSSVFCLFNAPGVRAFRPRRFYYAVQMNT
jgi:hypothetical protein